VNLLLFRSGWVLIGVILVLLLFQNLPLLINNPEWQLNLISSLLQTSHFLILGAVLITYSTRREDLDTRSLRQAKLLRTCVAWLSLVYLLLIPLQFISSTAIVKTNYFNGIASMRRLEKIVQILRETNTEQEFRAQLSRLPNVQDLPTKFDIPFTQVRDTVAETLMSRRAASLTQLAKTRDENMQVVIRDSFRNSASLALFSYGFIAIALADSSQRNIITSLAMLLEKLRASNLWFSSPRRRNKNTPINPSWINEDKK
jgi:hypothetical protein